MEKGKATPETSATDPGGKAKTDLTWYKNEVKNLRGKIQGYQALSSLLQESKQEIRQLKNKNGELLQRMEELVASGPSSMLDESLAVNSVTEEKQMALDDERKSGQMSIASENCELDDMEIVTHGDAVLTEDTRMTSEVPPSLEIDPYDLQVHAVMEGMTSGGATANPQDPFSLAHLAGTSTLMNPNPTTERTHRVSTSTANSDISASIVLISPEHHSDLPAPLLPGPALPGLSGQNGPLVNQVAHISEALTRNVGLGSPSDLSDALARLAIDVLKVEKELRMKQTLINNLCPENQELKTKLEATIHAREESIQHLRMEKSELQEKLSDVTRQQLSPEKPVQSPEWVHVQDPKSTQRLNERFEEQMRELESLHATEVQQLQAHVEDYRTKLRKAESAASKSREDSQRLLNMAKAHTQDEVKSKEVAISHFHSEQERRHQCESDLIAERRRAATLADELTALKTQLTIFQDSQLANNLSPQESLNSLAILSPQELRTKVHILQQQVSIYKEDFDRERHDRERVQADKDSIENGLTRYKADLVSTQRKVREMEQERELLKSENACLRQEFQQIRQSEQDVVRLQSENIQFREQLQQKIEEIRRMTSMPTAPPANAFPRDRVTTSETWRCSSCTFDNPDVRSSCEVCGRSRKRSTHNAMSSQAPRLIAHGGSGPPFGWTECDSTTNRVTRGDDLIIDEGEDVPDRS